MGEKTTKEYNINDFMYESIENIVKYTLVRDNPLDRLTELVEADKEGRCVVLPCKVGDTVFTIELDCKDNPDHSQMCFCWNKSCKECDKSYLRVWENRNKTADIRSIVAEMGLCGESGGFGKTVFLTRAEAEAALQKEAQHG